MIADRLFLDQGRPAKRVLYGLTSLAKSYEAEDIEAVTKDFADASNPSIAAIRRALDQRVAGKPPAPKLKQTAEEIRDIDEYQDFFDTHARSIDKETES